MLWQQLFWHAELQEPSPNFVKIYSVSINVSLENQTTKSFKSNVLILPINENIITFPFT